MQYSRTAFWMPVKLLLQFPKIIYRVYAEKRWLKKTVAAYKIDAVIADNRPGLSHKKIPSVYITHQLKIKTGNRFTERLAQKIHYRFINKFTACWVPDAAGEINLAGELSHPGVLPKVPVVYLGLLSRFQKKETDFKYDLCILLSGPEPQRSIFEKLILKDLNDFNGSVFMLRGLPGNSPMVEHNSGTLEIQDHLPAAALNTVIQQSKMIICRSGYTTIMDLIKLQKKALLVPTPGQTEQEYLAVYLQQQQLFCTVPQKDFILATTLNKATAFDFRETTFSQNTYEKAIEDFVKQIENKR
ncbi:MAG: glycosyltransferase [Ferruginibacter sp.]